MVFLRRMVRSLFSTKVAFEQRWFAWAIAVSVPLAMASREATAIDFVNVAQTAAMDQPQINLMLRLTNGTSLTGTEINPDAITNPFFNITDPPTIETVNIPAYLDTGASGILISSNTALRGVPIQTFGNVPVVFNDIGVGGPEPFHVSEPLRIGLAPFNPATNVHDESSYTELSSELRTQVEIFESGSISGSDSDFEKFLYQIYYGNLNVVGMPAMDGKTVVIDPRFTNATAQGLTSGSIDLDSIATGILFGDPNAVDAFNNLEKNLRLRTYVYEPNVSFDNSKNTTDPGIPSTSHHIKLTYSSFAEFTDLDPAPPDGFFPDLARNPFIGPDPVAKHLGQPSNGVPDVKITFNGKENHGSFLLDTGAAASMISRSLAEKLGVEYVPGTYNSDDELVTPKLQIVNENGEPTGDFLKQFTLTIGGIGGQARVAGFWLDSMLLRTIEGVEGNDDDPNHLRFVGAPVLVADIRIPDGNGGEIILDGIFGMNFLVGSMNLNNGGGIFPETVDYTAGAFDWITIDFSDHEFGVLGLQVVPEPHTVLLAGTAAVCAVGMRRKLKRRRASMLA